MFNDARLLHQTFEAYSCKHEVNIGTFFFIFEKPNYMINIDIDNHNERMFILLISLYT